MPRRSNKSIRPFMLARPLLDAEKTSLLTTLDCVSTASFLPVFFKASHFSDILVDSTLLPVLSYFQPFQIPTVVKAMPPVCSISADPIVRLLHDETRLARGLNALSKYQPFVFKLHRLVRYLSALSSSSLDALGLTARSLPASYFGPPLFTLLDPAVQAAILDELSISPSINYINGNVLDNRLANLHIQHSEQSKLKREQIDILKKRQLAASRFAGVDLTSVENLPAVELFSVPGANSDIVPVLAEDEQTLIQPELSAANNQKIDQIWENLAAQRKADQEKPEQEKPEQ